MGKVIPIAFWVCDSCDATKMEYDSDRPIILKKFYSGMYYLDYYFCCYDCLVKFLLEKGKNFDYSGYPKEMSKKEEGEEK